MEVTARVGASKQRQFFFSYVRQSARGDQTDVSSYLGDFPFPVVSSPIAASTIGEVPNRFHRTLSIATDLPGSRWMSCRTTFRPPLTSHATHAIFRQTYGAPKI